MSYNKVAKHIMTSKEAKNLISQKINKTFLFDKYFIIDYNKDILKMIRFLRIYPQKKMILLQ